MSNIDWPSWPPGNNWPYNWPSTPQAPVEPIQWNITPLSFEPDQVTITRASNGWSVEYDGLHLTVFTDYLKEYELRLVE